MASTGKTCGDRLANDYAPGAAVSGSAPQTLTAGLSSLRMALPIPVTRPPPPIAAITVTLRAVFEDLQPECRIPGDEVVVVERMDERAFDSWEGALLHRLPRGVERRLHD